MAVRRKQTKKKQTKKTTDKLEFKSQMKRNGYKIRVVPHNPAVDMSLIL